MSDHAAPPAPGWVRARRRVGEHLATRRPAEIDTARGLLWVAFIGLEYYLVMIPIAFIGSWHEVLVRINSLAVIMLVVQLTRLRPPRVPVALVVYVVLMVLSLSWSISPGDTWDAVLVYLNLAVIALMIAANCSARVMIWGALVGGTIFLGASVYAAYVAEIPAALIGPNPGLHGHIAGAAGNKNILAFGMVLAFGFAVACFPRRWAARLLWVLCVLSLVVGVYLSQSVTGYAAMVLLGVQGLVLHVTESWTPARRRRLLLGCGAVLAAVVLVLLLVPGLFNRVTDRDFMLSGRVPLWQAILEQVTAGDAVLGNGWGAVWYHYWQPAAPNEVAARIYEGAGTFMAHGHNSFLDVLPQLGVVGVLVLLWMHVLPLRRATVLRARPDAGAEGLLLGRMMITVVTSLLIFGITEPMTSIPVGWFCLVMMLELAARHRPARGRRARATY